jgi:quinol monooxygenase YgiN
MAKQGKENVICHYRVKPGAEGNFTALLRKHWPTLRRLGAVTARKSLIYRGADDEGRPMFWEIFEWKSDAAFQKAHRHPEVLAIWEPMDALCERRGSNPNMEFPHVAPLSLFK